MWPKASTKMEAKFRVNTGDIIFKRNEWVSQWMRGRIMELELGSYGKTGRWSAATADQAAKAEAEKDCPIRLQVLGKEFR